MPAGARESGATVKPPGTAVWDFSRAARAVPPFSVASSSARFFWKMKSLIERTYTTQNPGQDARTPSLEALSARHEKSNLANVGQINPSLLLCLLAHPLSQKI